MRLGKATFLGSVRHDVNVLYITKNKSYSQVITEAPKNFALQSEKWKEKDETKKCNY